MLENHSGWKKETTREVSACQRDKIFKTYEEGTSLFKQGDFEEAFNKYNQVISKGNNVDNDMVLKVVNAALRQREKCQFRLLK